jgi:hypothetical protein
MPPQHQHTMGYSLQVQDRRTRKPSCGFARASASACSQPTRIARGHGILTGQARPAKRGRPVVSQRDRERARRRDDAYSAAARSRSRHDSGRPVARHRVEAASHLRRHGRETMHCIFDAPCPKLGPRSPSDVSSGYAATNRTQPQVCRSVPPRKRRRDHCACLARLRGPGRGCPTTFGLCAG